MAGLASSSVATPVLALFGVAGLALFGGEATERRIVRPPAASVLLAFMLGLGPSFVGGVWMLAHNTLGMSIEERQARLKGLNLTASERQRIALGITRDGALIAPPTAAAFGRPSSVLFSGEVDRDVCVQLNPDRHEDVGELLTEMRFYGGDWEALAEGVIAIADDATQQRAFLELIWSMLCTES